MNVGRGCSFTFSDITLKKNYMNKGKIEIFKKTDIGTDPGTKRINIIICDQSVACIILKHIKMNKNMMGTLTYKIIKLIGVDQIQIRTLYLLGKLYAKSKLFGLTKY